MDCLCKRSAFGDTWIKEIFCRHRVLLEFTVVHLARNPTGLPPSTVDLCLFPCVCSRSCCCSHREKFLWASGCQCQWAAPTAAAAAALIPCLHPSSSARGSSCPFPSNWKRDTNFLGKFLLPTLIKSCPPCRMNSNYSCNNVFSIP